MNFFSFIINIYKSVETIGSIRNSTDPVLSFIDGITKYSDFIILKNKPKKDEMEDNLVYFFIDRNGELAYLTKRMNYDAPVILSEKEFESFTDLYGKSVYKKIKDHAIGDSDGIGELSKGAIYKFLIKKGKFTAGIKYFINQNIKIPFRYFEAGLKKYTPFLFKIYSATKRAFVSLCTFCASETGIRLLSLSTAISLAVATGGTFFIAAAAAYSAAMAYSIVKQSVNKMRLNNLNEEANLLEKFCRSYAKKLELATTKNIHFKDNFPKEKEFKLPDKQSAFQKWMQGSYGFFSTSIFEVAVPITTAFLSPGGAALELAIITASGAINSGVGVYSHKLTNEKMKLLRDAIDKAQKENFIPAYSNIQELREYVKLQENQVNALTKMPDNEKPEKALKIFNYLYSKENFDVKHSSSIGNFASAMYQVVNPFERKKDLKDEREVKFAIEDLKDSVMKAEEMRQNAYKKIENEKLDIAKDEVKDKVKALDGAAFVSFPSDRNRFFKIFNLTGLTKIGVKDVTR